MQNHQRTSSCAHASCSSACNPHTTTRRRLVSNISLVTPKNQADHARDDRICKLYDLHDTLVPYETAWDWQRLLVDRCLEASSSLREANTATRGGRVTRGDSLLILQHPSVYTLGAGSTTANLLFDPASSTVPLFRVERGGEVTYHGPGQLVMYPILNLQLHHRSDLHWYMRSLEQVVIQALEEVSGLRGERVAGLTGVWVSGHKLAAIGIRAKRWVTWHGLALNVTTDLEPFRSIVPCGIADRPVGSVRSMLGNEGYGSSDSSRGPELLTEYRFALLEAFEDVFDVKLEDGDVCHDLPGSDDT